MICKKPANFLQIGFITFVHVMYIKGEVSQGQTLDKKSLCSSSLSHWEQEFENI